MIDWSAPDLVRPQGRGHGGMEGSSSTSIQKAPMECTVNLLFVALQELDGKTTSKATIKNRPRADYGTRINYAMVTWGRHPAPEPSRWAGWATGSTFQNARHRHAALQTYAQRIIVQ